MSNPTIPVTDANPPSAPRARLRPPRRRARARPDCGHETVQHGDHVDYVVGGHLHHPHGDHCDHHGPAEALALLRRLVELLLTWSFEGTLRSEQIVKRVAAALRR